jgi:hypothetical protein
MEFPRSPSGNNNTIPVTNSTSGTRPFATLVGNLSNPHPYYNSSYGYVSPNLWDFTKGGGGTVMNLYNNSSIHLSTDLYNAGNGVGIFGYPSVHFTYNLPLSLNEIYKGNFSSFVSFSIKQVSQQVRYDVAYDMFLGKNSTPQYEVEIMLVDDLSGEVYSGQNATFSGVSVVIPIQINNDTEKVTWDLYIGNSASGVFPSYVFVPLINTSDSMSFKLAFTPFLSYLEDRSYLSSNVSILRVGIGSEFAASSLPHQSIALMYSFWIFSYFILDNVKYQVVQPEGVV